jgi:hypothetical protein
MTAFMFHISFILVLFLYQLSVGCILTLALMPLKEVDRKFYQLSCGLSSLLMAIALGLSFYYPFDLPKNFGISLEQLKGWPQAATGFFLAYLSVIFWTYVRLRRKKIDHAKGFVRFGALLGVLALAMEGLVFRPASLYCGLKALVMPVDFITAGAFLGVFMLAMVFGHWYLVQAMPKRLLRRMTEILIIILVIRILVVGGSLWVYAASVQGGAEAIRGMMDLWQGHGIFFWQRILTGLGIPLILSYMIWSTARIGANQSATGLLYVGVVFVIIGEIISKYMFVMSGIPI